MNTTKTSCARDDESFLPTVLRTTVFARCEHDVDIGDKCWPFGAKLVEDLSLPFCACGRLWSECDGLRRSCRKVSR